MSETKQLTRKQLVEDARASALSGDWDKAISINQQILERFPKDADAQNRLGRAYLEINKVDQGYEAYKAALQLDPANMIARRNLQRLELLRQNGPSADKHAAAGNIPRIAVFIEEVGKTWVDELVNPQEMSMLAGVSSGEQLTLRVDGVRLYAVRADGLVLGEIEAKTAERVVGLMKAGNTYEAYALGLSSRSLRVILREVSRMPELATTVSFPRQITQTRIYLRDRDALRQRDEADFFLLDDDDEDLEDDDSRNEPGEEDDGHMAEVDPFMPDTLRHEDEDSGL